MLIVAQNFQVGGIQRSLINTLECLSGEKNINIDLFVFGDGPLLDELPKVVNVIKGRRLLRLTATPFLVVWRSSLILEKLCRLFLMLKVRAVGSEKFYRSLLKKENLLSQYDVAISYFNDVPNSYFNQGTNQYVDEFVNAKRKIAWIHTDPIEANFSRYECIKKYRSFDRIACVSEACSNKFREFLPGFSEKVATVYNLFPLTKIRDLGNVRVSNYPVSNRIQLITVCRIDNQKRTHLIPEIVQKLINSNVKNFKWTVVGEGPDLISLKKRVDELQINDYLEFIGNKRNPYPFIKASSLFVLVSRYEGYPMVIGESLILGTPVLTTNFAAAVEQINDGRNGIIVGMTEYEIYSGICSVLNHCVRIAEMRSFLAENPYSNVLASQQLRGILETEDVND